MKRHSIACLATAVALGGAAAHAQQTPLAAPPGAPVSASAAPEGVASAGVSSANGAITITLRDAKLAEVFAMLSRTERVNILIGKGVEGTVSVNLYRVTVDEAIRAIADAAGYIAERRDSVYVVLDRKEAGRDAVSTNTQVRSFRVQYSNPKIVADILTKHLSRYGKITPLLERGLIVVEDQPDFMRRVAELLAEIDRQPRQVLIEAKILEIKLDHDESFGIDWTKIIHAGSRVIELGVKGLADRGAQGLFFSAVNDRLNLFLSALSAKGRVHTLATPKLLALENQEATTVIGGRIGYRVTTTINQVTTESIQFLESGVILRVMPSIDERGRIFMRIHPEVSSATLQNNIPLKNSTEVSTQLVAEDGQAIFIGGLIRSASGFHRTGVPLLSDVPVIGRAFSRDEETTALSETVIVITPTIVREATVPAPRLGEAERELDGRTRALEQNLREQTPRTPATAR